MKPIIFFATSFSWWVQTDAFSRPPRCIELRLLDLREIQFHRRRPTENRHRDTQLAFFVVDVFHVAVKVGERPFLDPPRLAHFEKHFRPRLFDAVLHLLQDAVHFLLRNGRRLVCRPAHEAGHLRRAFHEMPGVVGHFHLDQHVPGEKLALGNRLRAFFHFHYFFDRNQDLAEPIRHPRPLDAFRQRAHHAFLESRVGVNDKPLLVVHPSPRPVTSLTSHASDVSTANRKSAMTTTKAKTTPVV